MSRTSTLFAGFGTSVTLLALVIMQQPMPGTTHAALSPADSPCTEPADCASGICHSDGFQFLCGCQADDDCLWSQYCSVGYCTEGCGSDAQCGWGRFCKAHACYEENRKFGESCMFDEACVQGYCKPKDPSGLITRKYPGTCACREDSDCPEKLECNAGGRCEPHPCQVPHGDCPQGQFCLSYFETLPGGRGMVERGKCQDLYPNDAPCIDNSQCLSDACDHGPRGVTFPGTCIPGSSPPDPQNQEPDALAAAQARYDVAIQALAAAKETVNEAKRTLEEVKAAYGEAKDEKTEAKQTYLAAKADYRAATAENRAEIRETVNTAKVDYLAASQVVTETRVEYTATKTVYMEAKPLYAAAKRTAKIEAAALKAAQKAYDKATE
ncbi:MAG: hypothetical protein PHH13_04960 [Candidatus Peribacteraceae bacterium]|nr:hypothetical protein [Candidatus Peribacteraceae bacterium]